MAKVKGISVKTVKALAGWIDFYYWKGIPVARKWPDWHNFKMSTGQKRSSAIFANSRTAIKKITPKLREKYRLMTIGKKKAWLDSVTGQYMAYWKNVGKEPSIPINFEIFANSPTWTFRVWSSGSECPRLVLSTGPLFTPAQVICTKGIKSQCFGIPEGQEFYYDMTKKTFDISYKVPNYASYTNGGISRSYGFTDLPEAVRRNWYYYLLGQGRVHGSYNAIEYLSGGYTGGASPYNSWISGNWVEWRYRNYNFQAYYPGKLIDFAQFKVYNTSLYDRDCKLNIQSLGLNFPVTSGWSSISFTPPDSWQTPIAPYVKFEPDESVNGFMPGPLDHGWYKNAGIYAGCPQLWLYSGGSDYCEVVVDPSVFPPGEKIYFSLQDSSGNPLPGVPVEFVLD